MLIGFDLFIFLTVGQNADAPLNLTLDVVQQRIREHLSSLFIFFPSTNTTTICPFLPFHVLKQYPHPSHSNSTTPPPPPRLAVDFSSPGSSPRTMQTVPWPCLTVRCVPPSPTSRAPVSLKDGVGSRTPGLWLHFLGLLLSPFRTVLAPSPRRLDTKSR